MTSPTDLNTMVRAYTLLDGILHEGKAQVKSVMSKILGDHPELRIRARELGPQVARMIKEVATISVETQREELTSLEPRLLPPEQVEPSVPEEPELPSLPGAQPGQVVMRFAPGPSGPLHLGHSRAVILNDEYCKRYDGRFILRLEDTNPAAVDLATYDMIREDLEWLGVKVGQEVVQSSRLALYHSWAQKVLEGGYGYVCTCPADDWRALKNNQRPCPHRDEPSENQLERWARMQDGSYAEGEASVVVKTDLDHPNPAVRDFVALRISDVEHPLEPEARIWPVMNFSVAVDDHELGLTHVLRGKDHLNNTLRQEYLFDYFGWSKPHYTHYGFVKIPDVELKTSHIRKGIGDGTYRGWDDIRLGTLQTLRRRGYLPQALRAFWIEASIHEVEFNLSWENLNAWSKSLVDPDALRLFFVPKPQWFTFQLPEDPIKAPAAGSITSPNLTEPTPSSLQKRAPWQPDRPELGYREEVITNDAHLAIPSDDVQRLAESSLGPNLRLKNLCNTVMVSDTLRFNGTAQVKGTPIIQWVCDHVPLTLIYPDGRNVEGVAEPAAAEPRFQGQVVQFERVGFVRLEGESRAVFLHG